MYDYYIKPTQTDIDGLTNRQLLREYRDQLRHTKDVADCKESGSAYYLGISINVTLFRAKRDLSLIRKNVEQRYTKAKAADIELQVFGTQND